MACSCANEPISPPRHCLDVRPPFVTVAQGFTNRRDIYGQNPLFNKGVWPNFFEQCFFLYDTATVANEYNKGVERLGGEWNSRLSFGQNPLPDVHSERTEFVGHTAMGWLVSELHRSQRKAGRTGRPFGLRRQSAGQRSHAATALSVPDCSLPRGCRAPQSPLAWHVVIIIHLQRVGLETGDGLDLGRCGSAFKPRSRAPRLKVCQLHKAVFNRVLMRVV